MKCSRFRNYSLFAFAFTLFVSCSKKKKPLGMDVGKYEITQYKEYPNGDKDTLTWIGYGPSVYEDQYRFKIWDKNDQTASWQFFTDAKHINLFHYYGPYIHYTVDSYSSESSQLIVNYIPREVFGIVEDSASGKVVFNRISL